MVSPPVLNAAAKDGTACPMAFVKSVEPLRTHRVRAPTQAIKIASRSAIKVRGVQERRHGSRASRLTRIRLHRSI